MVLPIFILREPGSRIRLSFDIEVFRKSLFASTVMALAVYDIQALYYNKFYLPIYMLIGGAIYLAMLHLTNARARLQGTVRWLLSGSS